MPDNKRTAFNSSEIVSNRMILMYNDGTTQMHFELTSNYVEIIQFFIVNWNEKFFRMPVFKSSSV